MSIIIVVLFLFTSCTNTATNTVTSEKNIEDEIDDSSEKEIMEDNGDDDSKIGKHNNDNDEFSLSIREVIEEYGMTDVWPVVLSADSSTYIVAGYINEESGMEYIWADKSGKIICEEEHGTDSYIICSDFIDGLLLEAIYVGDDEWRFQFRLEKGGLVDVSDYLDDGEEIIDYVKDSTGTTLIVKYVHDTYDSHEEMVRFKDMHGNVKFESKVNEILSDHTYSGDEWVGRTPVLHYLKDSFYQIGSKYYDIEKKYVVGLKYIQMSKY